MIERLLLPYSCEKEVLIALLPIILDEIEAMSRIDACLHRR